MRKTYVMRGGKLVEKHLAGPPPGHREPNRGVMNDITERQSMVDGSVISSRSELRAHNRRHGVIDVGGDETVLKPKELSTPGGLGEEIKRSFDKLGY